MLSIQLVFMFLLVFWEVGESRLKSFAWRREGNWVPREPCWWYAEWSVLTTRKRRSYSICRSVSSKIVCLKLDKKSLIPKIAFVSKIGDFISFLVLAFFTNFCPIKTDLSGNTVWPQALGFQNLAKMDIFWQF